MGKITEIGQEKESSDCGFFCLYVAREISKGTKPAEITFEREDIYAFRNQVTGQTWPGKSPQSYLGLNFVASVIPILNGMGLRSYDVIVPHDLYPGRGLSRRVKKVGEVLNHFHEPHHRDVTFIALSAIKHWVLRLRSGDRWLIYDSSCVMTRSHLQWCKPNEVVDYVTRANGRIVTRRQDHWTRQRSSGAAVH